MLRQFCMNVAHRKMRYCGKFFYMFLYKIKIEKTEFSTDNESLLSSS